MAANIHVFLPELINWLLTYDEVTDDATRPSAIAVTVENLESKVNVSILGGGTISKKGLTL